MPEIVERAKAHLQRNAIISNGRSYTYQHLLDASTNVAAHLLPEQGDLSEAAIAFMIAPSFDYTAIQWGIWQAGGIAIPLCVLHPLPSLQYVLEDTQAKTLIVSPEYEAILAGLAKELGIELRLSGEVMEDRKVALPRIATDRRAMILYTSGTTSKPKGVVTTHANISFQISTLADAWEWEEDDHILEILPLHHVHGIINVMSCALWTGATCEFLPKFEASAVFEVFKKGRVNLFMAVPTIYFKMITYFENLSEEEQHLLAEKMKDFRLMVSGSAALPVTVLEKWRDISSQTLLERYGMTEIGMALSNSYRGERRPGHVGLPLPGVELRLVDEANNPVQSGESGEIQIKGPNVFLEYWNKPEATREAFTADGWFKTGDMAVFNNGSYKILGRNSVDIIKSGGYKISALEIEEVLRTHPDINECGVVGLPDEEWGEIVAASLVLDGDQIDQEALKNWLKDRLPGYKVPRKYIIQEALPRNTLGKVTKNELKKLF